MTNKPLLDVDLKVEKLREEIKLLRGDSQKLQAEIAQLLAQREALIREMEEKPPERLRSGLS